MGIGDWGFGFLAQTPKPQTKKPKPKTQNQKKIKNFFKKIKFKLNF